LAVTRAEAVVGVVAAEVAVLDVVVAPVPPEDPQAAARIPITGIRPRRRKRRKWSLRASVPVGARKAMCRSPLFAVSGNEYGLKRRTFTDVVPRWDDRGAHRCPRC
jgi:hypothetical protein